MKQRRYTAKAKSRSASSKGRLVTVNEDTTLLPFLFELLKEQSKSSVKSILANRQISVNGRTTTQFDTPLRSGDEVRISFQRGREDFRHPMLRLVWEDDSLIVVDKRNGLLSMATDKIKEKTAYHYLTASIKVVPQGKEMTASLTKCGFKEAKFCTFTFGICSMYTGIK